MKKLKELYKKFLRKILPLKNIILLESLPDFADNTKAVFDEMIKRGLNEKYKMYWMVGQKSSLFPKIKNVKFINIETPLGKLKFASIWASARCIICCNRIFDTTRKGQISFYLSHGMPIKSVRSYYCIPDTMDYIITACDKMNDVFTYELNCTKNNVFGLGYPRNDDLVNTDKDIKTALETVCEKVIVWYPTFRQGGNGVKSASKNALPIIYDEEKAISLNECAKENNTLLVLKPHFAQDLSYVKKLNLSNIRFIDDNFFLNNKMTSYEFVGKCDALITDYSSIYYDFTLCDKPIALIWEDIDEYKIKPGLVDNYEYYTKGAEKIFTLDELKYFIKNVANGVDNLKAERNEIKFVANYSDDGKSSERVVDFLLKKIKE